MKIILLGPPGSGKGTQAAKLAEKFSLQHLSTGDVFRAALKDSGSALGKKIKSFIEQGQLVPDELVSEVVFEKLKEMGSGVSIILDGYPRTVNQAQSLDAFSKENNFQFDAVINYEVSEAELFKRLKIRREKENRADDKDEVIKDRIDVYNKQTAPVLNHYGNDNRFINVNAEQSIDDVFEQTVSKLNTVNS